MIPDDCAREPAAYCVVSQSTPLATPIDSVRRARADFRWKRPRRSATVIRRRDRASHDDGASICAETIAENSMKVAISWFSRP